MKAGILNPEKTTTARQRQVKHTSAVTNNHARTEELLESGFSMRPMSRLYTGNQEKFAKNKCLNHTPQTPDYPNCNSAMKGNDGTNRILYHDIAAQIITEPPPSVFHSWNRTRHSGLEGSWGVLQT
jgi:hypothetical protein